MITIRLSPFLQPSAFILATLLFLTGCATESRVVSIDGDLYKITKFGGWGYDLKSLKSGVNAQARAFASSAGKDLEVVDESVTPDSRVDVYPADDDTYTLTFRLIERKKKQEAQTVPQ